MHCHTCLFWESPVDYDRMKALSTDQAKCCVAPPAVMLVPMSDPLRGQGLTPMCFWPQVPAFSMCKQWEPFDGDVEAHVAGHEPAAKSSVLVEGSSIAS